MGQSMGHSKFAMFLQRMHLVEFDEDIEEEVQPRQRRTEPQAGSRNSSVFESRYDASRGVKRPASASRPAKSSVSTRRTPVSTAMEPSEEKKPVRKPDTAIYYLGSIRECAEVIRSVISGASVFVNLEDVDDRTMQRIVDTLSGAAFALNAKVRKISENAYLIAPENVNVNMSNHIERRY